MCTPHGFFLKNKLFFYKNKYKIVLVAIFYKDDFF